MKFKKGDIIRNRYSVTGVDVKVEVLDVKENGRITVLYNSKQIYEVEPEWFDLVKRKGISFK